LLQCEKIQDNITIRDDCYLSMAVGTNSDNLNVSYCEKIVNNEKKDECIKVCAYWLVNTKLCEKIQNITIENSCVDRIKRTYSKVN
jgi:hypothetical protein